MQRTKNEWQKQWRTENVEILKTRRRWYEINKERLDSSKRAYCQQNKEHIRNYRRRYRKNNREQINKYWKSYYAKNKEQINQRLRNRRQRKIGAQESEKLETSPSISEDLMTILSEAHHGVLLRDFVEETVFKVSMFDFSILNTLLHSLNTERAYKRSAVCTLFASFAPIMAAFCNGHYRYKSSAKSVVVCFQKMIR